jgi:hypothetical protein
MNDRNSTSNRIIGQNIPGKNLPSTGQSIDQTPRCPNFGESYRPTDALGFKGDITERHPVSTSQHIDLQEGTPVLVLKAHCPCGWSATNVIDAPTPNSSEDDRSEFRIKIDSDAVEAADVKEALSRGGFKTHAFVVTETSTAHDGDIDA